ncbi:class I SAM-dependent methyltransferase [Synoicihabitans lomoniglobus]|uniref:class I SAM-dependent methyltransferase n=1 Tax=Synoicihabitans lomoniglobus TaxID=2909285 RepID=UPI002ED5F0D3|nr:class I SAM-dependent methyltransferase [Opitutaceae bacterium LMO-M01]
MSSLPPVKIRDLPRIFIKEELARYFNATPPEDIVPCDYAIWRCSETGFEFAEPRIPGNNAFYEWISNMPHYYPDHRWEYDIVAAKLNDVAVWDRPLRVLDIGCGSGNFLAKLPPRVEKWGLDSTPSAISKCRERGIHALNNTMSEAIAQDESLRSSFDCVTAFHCLEHVADPVDFIGEMIQFLAPIGRLFVSTPYSPMSFESDWFDVQNHPPHHLGRWNKTAYQRLAALQGMQVKLHMPPAAPLLARMFQTTRYRLVGPTRPLSRIRQTVAMLAHIPTTLRILVHQLKRERIAGRMAADTVLVEFNQ